MSDSVPNSATDYCNGPILHALTGVNNSSAKLEKELNALRQKSIYNLQNFNEEYGWKEKPQNDPLKQRLINKSKSKYKCGKDLLISFLWSVLPILNWLPKYSWRKNIIIDVMGGLTVGVMSVPQGMAYARLAGMPPVHGLYMNIFPTIIYVLFGTSRHASIGAVTLMSLMMGTIRYRFLPCEDCWMANVTQNLSTTSSGAVDYNSLTPIAIGTSTAFLVGIFMIGMGMIRLDILTTYLSDQLVTGFTVGAAVHIFTAQLDATFGLKVQKTSGPGKLIRDYINLFRIIHNTNFATMIISWTSVIFLVILKLFINPRVQPKIRLPIPGELIVVIIGILVSCLVNVNEVYHVKIVDFIPSVFPNPSSPRFDIMQNLAVDAFLIAILTYCQAISQAKLYAKLHKYKINGQQEFFAYGVMNLVSSFFQCFNSGLSVSRTIVYEKTGAKSQLAALVGVGIVIITILFISPYLALLPQGILASIIIVACVDLLRQLKELKYLWHVSKIDFTIYVVTIVAIVLLDVTYGLLFSIIFALFSVVIRTQCRSVNIVGNAPSTHIYAEMHRYSSIKEIPGVKIVHFAAPLYYANVDAFMKKLFKKCSQDATKQTEVIDDKVSATSEDGCSKHIIIDCSGMIYVDLMGINALKQVFLELTKNENIVCFAQINGSVQKMLHKANFFDVVPKESIFITVRDAVHNATESDKNNNENTTDTLNESAV